MHLLFKLSGNRFELLEQTLPELKPGYARIKVSAAALNRRDFWITQGQYPGIVTPIVLGSDGSGTVTAIPDGHEKWVGQDVIVNPSLRWGDNPAFQSESFSILGLPENGTLASMVDVPIENLFHKPAHLTHEQAAALPLAGVTAWRALVTRGRCQPGDTVLISGIGGGVALLPCNLQKYGMQGGSHQQPGIKLELAKKAGADDGILYTQENWRKTLAKPTPLVSMSLSTALGARALEN